MAKGGNQQQNSLQKTTDEPAAAPMRRLSEESAEQLRGIASRSPEKLRKTLERLAALAGEGANTTSREK